MTTITIEQRYAAALGDRDVTIIQLEQGIVEMRDALGKVARELDATKKELAELKAKQVVEPEINGSVVEGLARRVDDPGVEE